MKKLTCLTLTLLFTALAFTTVTAQQEWQRWGLPEGAKMRLGKGSIREIAYSPDGTLLAVATSIGIWLYDTKTYQERALLRGHSYWVSSVAFSPDGTTLASGSEDIRLWDTATGELLHTLTVPTSDVSSVAFSPDGQTLASAGWRGTVRLWNVATGEPRQTLTVPTSNSYFAFSPDGQTLTSWGGDYQISPTIPLWDVATGETIHTLTEPTGNAYSVAFSPDGHTLASGDGRGTVRLWNVATGEPRHTLTGHTGRVSSVAFSPDGHTLASGDGTSTVRLWNVATGEPRHTLTGHTVGVSSVAFSPDGHTLASAGAAAIQLWDTATGTLQATLEGQYGPRMPVFSPDGRTLASGGNTVQLWDVATGEPRHILSRPTSWVHSVAFSPDGTTLASGSFDIIRLWDTATGTLQTTLEGHTDFVTSIAFSPDGQTLASGSWDNTVRLWDAHTGQPLSTLEGHTGSVYNVAFSPDGTTLASGCYWSVDDKTIRLWDVQTGQLRATLTGHTVAPEGFAFSPDGTTLISTSSDSTIRVWDVRGGKHIGALGVPCMATSGPAMSPDGRFIAVGDGFFRILLIDFTASKIIGSFPGQDTMTDEVAISPDGTTLASASQVGTTILWDLTPFTSQEQSPEEYSDSVRVVYFQPSDREYQSGINARLETLIEDVQRFYAEQMETHGHSGKTVTFDEDFGVWHFTGEFTDAYYQTETYDKVQKEIGEYFYQSKNVYLVAIDISSEVINDDGTCGVGGGQGWYSSFEGEAWHRELGGLAVIPASGDCFNVGVAAHELGHAMGLDHDFRDDTYLMAYGSQQRLSREAAAGLDASRLFNSSQPDLGLPATLEMLSAGAGQLRFQVTDADGLHQAQLLIPATSADPAQGTKLHSGKALNGDSSSIVAFAVPELTSDAAVTLQVIDVHGNIAKQAFSIDAAGGVRVVADINGDGVVNIQDLVLVANNFGETGQPAADVNGDGVVNIQDLVKVAGAIGGDGAAAPAAVPEVLELFSAAEVAQWLSQAHRLALTDAVSQRGIHYLQHLLAVLTPKETVLLANYPNPFNPETWLPYRLAEPEEVTVRIYAANGSLIRMLALGHQPAGVYQSRSRAAYWDGRNAQGEPVASGVYFYTLSVGEFSATRKMVIRK